MAAWPQNLSLPAFKQALPVSKTSVYGYFFDTFADRIKVRNPQLGIPKLKKILLATFKISSRSGFHAMSLRDLCQEADLSMGGMYNYFGSKDDLSYMINQFVVETLDTICYSVLPEVDDVECRLESMIRLAIYMGELFHPWYYFVLMEGKSLPKSQREAVKHYEKRNVDELCKLVEIGNASGLFHAGSAALISTAILSLTQTWVLKRRDFQASSISVQEYADFVVTSVRTLLNPSPPATKIVGLIS